MKFAELLTGNSTDVKSESNSLADESVNFPNRASKFSRHLKVAQTGILMLAIALVSVVTLLPGKSLASHGGQDPTTLYFGTIGPDPINIGYKILPIFFPKTDGFDYDVKVESFCGNIHISNRSTKSVQGIDFVIVRTSGKNYHDTDVSLAILGNGHLKFTLGEAVATGRSLNSIVDPNENTRVINNGTADCPDAWIDSHAAGSSGYGVTEGGKFEFTVNMPRDSVATGTRTVSYTVASDNASVTVDSTSGTLTFPAGTTSKTATVNLSGTGIGPTDAAKITVTLTDGDYYDVHPEFDEIVVDVKDNDVQSATTPAITIAGPATNTIVANESSSFTVTADSGGQTTNLASDRTVNLRATATGAGFNVAGYFLRAGETRDFRLVVDATTKSRNFSVIAGAKPETGSGTLKIELLEGLNYVLSETLTEREITATLSDPPPMVESLVATSVDEGTGQTSTDSTVTVSIEDGVAEDFALTWTVTAESWNTADRSDFVQGSATGPILTGQVEFLAAQRTAGEAMFTIPINADSDPEADETYTVRISNPVKKSDGTPYDGVRVPPGGMATGGLIRNDDSNVVSIGPSSVEEFETYTDPLNPNEEIKPSVPFAVLLTDQVPTGSEVSLTWTVSAETGDTADFNDFDVSGSNFPTGTLTIEEGAEFGLFNVPISSDTNIERDETFTVTLSQLTATNNATVVFEGGGTTLSTKGTIVNNDIVLSISTDATGDEAFLGDSFNLTVTATPPPIEDLEVALNFTAERGSPALSVPCVDPNEIPYFQSTDCGNNVSGTATNVLSSIVTRTDPVVLESGQTFGTVTITPASGRFSSSANIEVFTREQGERGTYTFSAEVGDTHLAGVDFKQVVTLRDKGPSANLPRLYISGPRATVAANAGEKAVFRIMADTGNEMSAAGIPISPASVPIKYQLSQTGDFIASWVDLTDSVNLTGNVRDDDGRFITALEISTRDPGGNNAEGSITVTLLEGEGYTLPDRDNRFATATVGTDAIVMSIERAAGTGDAFGINEGASGTTDFGFKVKLSEVPTSPIWVDYVVHSNVVAFSDSINVRDYSNNYMVRKALEDELKFLLCLKDEFVKAGYESTCSQVYDSEVGKVYANDLPITGNTDFNADTDDFESGTLTGTVKFEEVNGAIPTELPIAVKVKGDSDNERHEDFFVSLTNMRSAAGHSLADGAVAYSERSVAHRILNDDWENLTIAPLTASVAEGNGGITQFAFTLTLTNPVVEPFTVHWGVTPGATDPADVNDFLIEREVDGQTLPVRDFRFPTGSVHFGLTEQSASGPVTATSKTFTVPISGDTDIEPNETFVVTLASPTGGSVRLGSTSTATGTINNDETSVLPVLSIIGPESPVSEGTGSAAFTVVSTTNPGTSFSFNYTPMNEDDDTDFLTSSVADLTKAAELTFSVATSGRSGFEATLDITLDDDDVIENTGRIKVVLAGGTGYRVASSSDGHIAYATIHDDESVELSFGENIPTTQTEGDPGDSNVGVIRFPLKTSLTTFNGALTVNYTLKDLGLGDFVNEATREVGENSPGSVWGRGYYTETVTFTNGAGMLPVNYTVDERIDLNGEIQLTLVEDESVSAPELSYTLPVAEGERSVEVEMMDDDGPGLRINGATANEKTTNNISSRVSFTVELVDSAGQLHNATEAFSFTWSTVDGTAIAGVDYEGVTDGSGTIDLGKPSTTVNVIVSDDNRIEGDETFRVELNKDDSLNQILIGSAVGTIVDDENFRLTIADSTVIEGDSGETDLTFTVSLVDGLNAPADGIQFNWRTVDGTATAPEDFTAVTQEFGLIPEGQNSTTIAVKVKGDTDFENNELITVVLTEAITIDQIDIPIERNRATGTINNDDTLPANLGISVRAGNINNSIIEGQTAEFILESPFQVNIPNVRVEVSQIGGYVISPIPRIVELINGRYDLRIPTIDILQNAIVEGSITVRVSQAGQTQTDEATVTVLNRQRSIEAAGAARITIANLAIEAILRSTAGSQEAPAQSAPRIPMVQISPMATSIAEGSDAQFVIKASPPPETGLTVNVVISETGDFIDFPSRIAVPIYPGETTAEVDIPTLDDDLAEEDGDVVARIDSGNGYSVGNSNIARVRVTDEHDRSVQRNHVAQASNAVLPILMGSIGARSLGTAENRISSAFDPGAENVIEIGGQSTIKDMVTTGGELANDGSVSYRELLGNSSFAVALNPEEGLVNPATFWGIGDMRSISNGGIEDSDVTRGELFVGHLGMDAVIGDGLVAGLATSHSQGELDYGETNDSINFRVQMTGLHPYIGLRSADDDANLRFVAGYGLGDILMDQEKYAIEHMDSSFHNVGLSGTWQFLSTGSDPGAGFGNLNIEIESWMASQFVKGQGVLVSGLRSDAHHTRIAIVGTGEHKLESGTFISPTASLGLRADGKNRQSFNGMEFGGGLSVGFPQSVKISSEGELLAVNPNQIREWSVSGLFSFDSGNDRLGALLSVTPQWGGKGMNNDDPIWGGQILDHNFSSGAVANGGRIDAEIGYGFEVWDGTVTPYSGILVTENQGDQYRLGSEFSFGGVLQFDLEGTREFRNGDFDKNNLKLNGRINW